MQWVHELPGTTFSNTNQRGEYDAEKMAALTLRELERWLTLAVSGGEETRKTGGHRRRKKTDYSGQQKRAD
jgi:putative transposase